MDDQTKMEQPGRAGTLTNNIETDMLNLSYHDFAKKKLKGAQKDTKKVEEDLEEDLKGFKTI